MNAFKMAVLIFLLSFLPFANAADTTKTCSDANTLYIVTNKTIITDGIPETLEITENKNCQFGCVNGECRPVQSSIPIEIYIFLCCFGIVMMLLSFFQDDILLFPWITVIIFTMLSIMSLNLSRVFCEYVSSGWECYVHSFGGKNLMYLWAGLGVIMFALALIKSIEKPAQELARAEDRL